MPSGASGHRMDRENTRLAVSQTNQQAPAASKMKDEACQPACRVGVTEGGTLSEGCTGISWDESPLGVDFEKPSQEVHKGRSVLGSCCGDFRDR